MSITPLRAGLALATTVAFFYALCTLIWWFAPGPFLGFMNNLFHGMDFTVLVQPKPFLWSGFLLALLALSFWALLAGSFLGWLLARLAR